MDRFTVRPQLNQRNRNRHKLTKIKEGQEIEFWYVDTKENPADLASHGKPMNGLVTKRICSGTASSNFQMEMQILSIKVHLLSWQSKAIDQQFSIKYQMLLGRSYRKSRSERKQLISSHHMTLTRRSVKLLTNSSAQQFELTDSSKVSSQM